LAESGALGPVAIGAKRIIEVDAFDLEFQLSDFRFSPPDSPYLELMAVAIRWTNTDLRSGTE